MMVADLMPNGGCGASCFFAFPRMKRGGVTSSQHVLTRNNYGLCPDHRRGEQRCRLLSCRHLLWYCSCLECNMDTSRLVLQWILFPTPVSQNQQRKNIDDDQQQSQGIITSDITPRTCTEQRRASEREKIGGEHRSIYVAQ
jgi:hypothetical protein